MDLIHALAIAVLQGATELFPVSSLGHAVVVPAVLKWGIDQRSHEFLPFLVLLHAGTVVALLAQEGAKLEKGAAILTLEVMKMEQTLRAPYAGTLKKIKCKVGDIVGEGIELAEVEKS